MQGLLTPSGLRGLVARKIDSLAHDRDEGYANGDLSALDAQAKFYAFLRYNQGFDKDTAVKVELRVFENVFVEIHADKYAFALQYVPVSNTSDSDEEETAHDAEADMDTFLEIYGTAWIYARISISLQTMACDAV